MRYVMNDYELVYLIQNESDEVALEYLFKKYHKLIWKHVHIMNLSSMEHDDFYQEGLLILNKAIQTFNPDKNKSFTRYFELILRRHLYLIQSRLPKYTLCEDASFFKGVTYIVEEEPEILFYSQMENDIYKAYFIDRMKIKDIASKYPYHIKQIYNTIYRIKEKYKIVI
jgi:RNA polymerase sporulation-specific sigma factor